jgi:hypothetical protein
VVVDVDGDNDNIDDEDASLLDIIHCNQLVIETLQYTYNEINIKQYMIERKPYHTGLNDIFQHDLQGKDNHDSHHLGC